MQWGVIEDWADSEGYIMNIFENDGGGKWGIYITTVSLCRSTSYGYKWNTRPEARKAAIEKLNELINN